MRARLHGLLRFSSASAESLGTRWCHVVQASYEELDDIEQLVDFTSQDEFEKFLTVR